MYPVLGLWIALTYLGDIYLWVAFLFLLGIWMHKFEKDKKHKIFEKRFLLHVFASVMIAAIIVLIIKVAVSAPRQCIPCTNITALAGSCNPYCPDDPYSFPSGHASIAFAGFTGAFMSLRRKKIIHLSIFILPALTSLSRIMLGVHTPAEVLAGSLLGIIVTYILCEFVLKPHFEKRH